MGTVGDLGRLPFTTKDELKENQAATPPWGDVLAVSVDSDTAKVKPFVAEHRLTFPILLDPDLKTAGAWRVTGLPATFIVKPGGEVAGMAVGARDWNSAEMRALLETLLPVVDK